MVSTNVKLPSNRKFGLFWIAIFSLMSAYSFLIGNSNWWYIWIFNALLLAIVLILNDKLLAPLNVGWMLLGQLLGKFMTPIILAIFFFGIITPISVSMKIFGRDELRLKKRNLPTYWVDVVKNKQLILSKLQH